MFPRLVVQVGRDAEVTVIERHVSSDVEALVVPVTELDVAEAGRLRYVDVQVLGPRVWQVAHQASRVDFPRGLKEMMSARFGTSPVCRIG